MIPFLCLVVGLCLGFAAGIAIGGSPIDPPWADLEGFEGGAAHGAGARPSFRVVGEEEPQGPGTRHRVSPAPTRSVPPCRPSARPGREHPGGPSVA